MPRFSQFVRAKRPLVSWQGALICLAILCLNAHLARRFHLPLSGTATVQSNSAKVQHMDRDAHRWIPPTWSASFQFVPTLSPALPAQGSNYLSLSVSFLYDRPPPVFR